MKIDEIIASYIMDYQKSKPIIVDFDNENKSRKTVIKKKKKKKKKNNNKNALRVSIDKFHNPKEIRLQKG
jgi:RecA/RadA recombinase